MERPKVIYKENDLGYLMEGESLISQILRDISINYEILPKKFQLIGIAQNVLLGVFGIIYEDGIYNCYRMYYERGKLLVADKGYPVTNMDSPSDIECLMDYVISVRTISRYSNHNMKSVI